MSHDLEFDEHGARFAYADHIDPWHRLGTPMRGLQTIDAMLAAARADYLVELLRVVALGPDGEPLRNPDGSYVEIEDSRASVRINRDDSFNGLATVGTRFVATQNRQVLEQAVAIVGASGGEAVMDTVGVLDGGREFFATIDLGPLVIDPAGVADKIERYLVVRNGFNGKTPITYANTDVRAVCKNTVLMAVQTAPRVFKARHTRNVEDLSLQDARRVLAINVDWAVGFKNMAESMLKIDVPASSARFDSVLDAAFPLKSGASDRQKRNRDEVFDRVRWLHGNNRNAGGYGTNGWSAYNAVVEYLDHHRSGKVENRAVATMNETSWVSEAKLMAQQKVLSFA